MGFERIFQKIEMCMIPLLPPIIFFIVDQLVWSIYRQVKRVSENDQLMHYLNHRQMRHIYTEIQIVKEKN